MTGRTARWPRSQRDTTVTETGPRGRLLGQHLQHQPSLNDPRHHDADEQVHPRLRESSQAERVDMLGGNPAASL